MQSEIELRDLVLEILRGSFQISKEKLSSDYWDTQLTGKHFGLGGGSLTYLFFELEKRLKITIKPELLEDGDFMTINGITKVLSKASNNSAFKVS